MNFEEILQSLEMLTPYELRRIENRSSDLAEEESKLKPIRNALKPNMSITYFNYKLNKEVRAVIENVRNTKVSVVHVEDGARWTTGICNINLENIDVKSVGSFKQGTLSKSNLSVGDTVGFEHKGQDIIGQIIRLNPKRAKLKLEDGHIWNVWYGHLFPVVDGNSGFHQGLFIEGDVIEGEIVA